MYLLQSMLRWRHAVHNSLSNYLETRVTSMVSAKNTDKSHLEYMYSNMTDTTIPLAIT